MVWHQTSMVWPQNPSQSNQNDEKEHPLGTNRKVNGNTKTWSAFPNKEMTNKEESLVSESRNDSNMAEL